MNSGVIDRFTDIFTRYIDSGFGLLGGEVTFLAASASSDPAAPGPRQIPAEANADSTRSPRKTLISASFLTEASALERHIPDRFTLVGDPVVTVEFHYMTDIDWLAGQGYTMIRVWWPAMFKGARDQIVGRFLAVMWENLADPIITGRGEIGQPKLYAEIPEL
jgi:hypothetical protein